MFLSRAETKARAAARAQHAARVQGLVRAAFGLSEHDGVTVNEIACPDPGCPDTETVILLMVRGSPTRAVKIAKALAAVDAADVDAAASAATAEI